MDLFYFLYYDLFRSYYDEHITELYQNHEKNTAMEKSI